MTARYHHRRMTPQELSDALNDAGLSFNQFSRFTGVQPRTLQKYLHDSDAEIPHWIRVFLDLMRTPANMDRAQKVTEYALIRDDRQNNG